MKSKGWKPLPTTTTIIQPNCLVQREKKRFTRNYVTFMVLILLTGLVTVSLIYKFSVPSMAIEKPYWGRSTINESECSIPQLDPFDQSIKHLLVNKAPNLNCEKDYPFLFNSTFESAIIPQKNEAYFRNELKIESCCYKTVERDWLAWDPDNSLSYKRKCYPISLVESTNIPPEHEFIVIYCKEYDTPDEISSTAYYGKVYDIHAFVPLKPEVEERIAKLPREMQKQDKFNVAIYGMDAISRMNFLRTMPLSHSYLINEMSAVEMVGYNKVGENTFPNLSPLLTSKTGPALKRSCGSWINGFDSCPFIWKEFSKKGYYTSYAEDLPGVAAFNFRNLGFRQPPTDFYPRAYSKSAVENIGTNLQISAYYCYGPRIPFVIWLDYMEKLFYTMRKNKRNFFHFSWSTSITHDELHTSMLGDKPLLATMKWLKEHDYLNDTIFILMSDHGHRIHPIRQTSQGQLEDRLPLMYFVFPESFKVKYEQAYQNLLENKHRLITTFDLHETFKDILNIEEIEESALRKRELKLTLQEHSKMLPTGISLFLPISKFRTCEAAGIELNFCTCLSFKETFTNESVVNDKMDKIMKHINGILLKVEKRCAQLQLDEVTMAQRAGEESGRIQAYLINFRTNPGGGLYEAVVSKKRDSAEWQISGSVIRTNSYKNQSHCLESGDAKPYCYCLS